MDGTPEMVLDMGGNVVEWCADRQAGKCIPRDARGDVFDWVAEDYHAESPLEDLPVLGAISPRMCRGCCWHLHAGFCRSARRRGVPGCRGDDLGFRLARTVS